MYTPLSTNTSPSNIFAIVKAQSDCVSPPFVLSRHFANPVICDKRDTLSDRTQHDGLPEIARSSVVSSKRCRDDRSSAPMRMPETIDDEASLPKGLRNGELKTSCVIWSQKLQTNMAVTTGVHQVDNGGFI